MPVTQRRRSFQLFRKMKFSNCASTTSGDEGQLEIDKMILHVLDCLGALQCVMGQYDASRAKVFWGAVATIAEIGVDQAIGHVDRRHPGASHLLRAFPNDLKATDGRGWLPLHWAAVTDDVDIEDVRNIARADPLATVKGCNQPISATPGHLIAAVRHPRIEVVRCLYNFYPRMAMAKDSDGDEPLHYAARYSESIEMIQFLLQANPAATKVRGEGNFVPLQNALFNESEHRVSIVKSLLDADPSAASILNADGDTVFHLAINQECRVDLLQHLLTAYPQGLAVQNDIGHLPLHAACLTKDLPRSLENVELLLQHYPQAAKVPCIYGHIPAHIAAESSTPQVLHAVLAVYPEGLHYACPEDNLNTPLMKAVISGNEENVRFITQHYPHVTQVSNSIGLNPMHFAAENDNLSIMQMIFKVFPDSVRLPDAAGRLPLHVFVQTHQEVFNESGSESDCLRFLLKVYPDSVAAVDHANEAPLALATMENRYLRRLLLRAQPEIFPDELKSLNYVNRRLGLFLAFAAINADGIPNIFSRLRATEAHLLRHTLSYL
jgi:ankyrin repeat protein